MGAITYNNDNEAVQTQQVEIFLVEWTHVSLLSLPEDLQGATMIIVSASPKDLLEPYLRSIS
jgi:hypothetical protein